MTKLIIYLTFVPWFLYFIVLCKNALKVLKENKMSKIWLKENIFKIFRFDNIILFAIFFYFSAYHHEANQILLVDTMLFSAINLYLFINTYYDKNKNNNKIDQNDISTILILLLITLIPFIYYTSTNNYVITYYILFAYGFFNYLIVFISRCINIFINNKVRSKNENK